MEDGRRKQSCPYISCFKADGRYWKELAYRHDIVPTSKLTAILCHFFHWYSKDERDFLWTTAHVVVIVDSKNSKEEYPFTQIRANHLPNHRYLTWAMGRRPPVDAIGCRMHTCSKIHHLTSKMTHSVGDWMNTYAFAGIHLGNAKIASDAHGVKVKCWIRICSSRRQHRGYSNSEEWAEQLWILLSGRLTHHERMINDIRSTVTAWVQ